MRIVISPSRRQQEVHVRPERDEPCQAGMFEPEVWHECARPGGHAPIARGQANVHICTCGRTWDPA